MSLLPPPPVPAEWMNVAADIANGVKHLVTEVQSYEQYGIYWAKPLNSFVTIPVTTDVGRQEHQSMTTSLIKKAS